MTMTTAVEYVVLVDDAGNPIGRAAKAGVHTADTPLHLAFSCHIFDRDGRVLITRRSLSKRAWPGVWTNSVCGHPAPDEPDTDAVRRRAQRELGVDVDDVRIALPDFRYTATDASGIVENEICPVYMATVAGELHPDPSEVCEYRWADVADVRRAVESAPWVFSPWMVSQVMSMPEYR